MKINLVIEMKLAAHSLAVQEELGVGIVVGQIGLRQRIAIPCRGKIK
jgi:hypothetical protein